MNKKIVIYTCITGKYDIPVDGFERKDGYDYFLYSDSPIETKSWTNIVYDWKGMEELTATKKQRFIKTHPHKLFKDYNIAVWVDGNTSVNDKLYNYINNNKKNPITFKKHPKRDCIYVEADTVKKCKKETPEICEKTKEFLKEENYPEHNGLYETNIIISHHKNKNVKKLFNAWWDNILKLSKRDQLSLNYTIWKLKLENTITCVATNDFPPKPHISPKLKAPKDFIKTYITYFDDKQIEEYNLKEYENTILFKGNDTSYTGDSINHLNAYYCELCTLYYIWKNELKSNFVVLKQYRRQFDWIKTRRLPKEGEIITYKPIKTKKPILVQYATFHGIKRYFDLKNTIKSMFGEQSKEFKYFTEEHILFTNNTMVIQWEDFTKMCEFVFSVLFTIDEYYQLNMREDRYEMNAIMFTEDFNYDYQKHWMAYIGERLISCFIYNHLKVITTERPKDNGFYKPYQKTIEN